MAAKFTPLGCILIVWHCALPLLPYSAISTSFASLLFVFGIGNEIYYIPESTQKQEGQREAGSEINQHNKSADINMNYGVCGRVFALQILIAGFTTVCGNTFAFACAQYVGCCVMNSIKRTRANYNVYVFLLLMRINK
jgi:hypothetical protein